MDRPPIIIEKIYSVQISKIWKAQTGDTNVILTHRSIEKLC